MASIIGLYPIGTTSVDFLDDLSSGKAQLLTGFGTRLNISTAATGDDIWTGTAAVIPIPPDAGEQMTLVSTSDEDGAAGKTGALTVMIHYLNASGLPTVETVTMNGKTPVNTVATNIRFVQEIHVKTAGSNLLAVGTITIYKLGSASTIYNQILPQTNISLNTARMVPSNKICLIWTFNSSAGGGKAADIRLRVTSHEGILYPKIFIFKDNMMMLDNANARIYRTPRVIPPLGIIKITAFAVSAVGGANVQGSWEGILIDVPSA